MYLSTHVPFTALVEALFIALIHALTFDAPFHTQGLFISAELCLSESIKGDWLGAGKIVATNLCFNEEVADNRVVLLLHHELRLVQVVDFVLDELQLVLGRNPLSLLSYLLILIPLNKVLDGSFESEDLLVQRLQGLKHLVLVHCGTEICSIAIVVPLGIDTRLYLRNLWLVVRHVFIEGILQLVVAVRQ